MAQIDLHKFLIFILFIYLLDKFQNKDYKNIDLLFLYILTGLIITFKSFYFLYLIFSIPFYFLF